MQLTGNFTALLQTLSLSQGLFKPVPSVNTATFQGKLRTSVPPLLKEPIRIDSLNDPFVAVSPTTFVGQVLNSQDPCYVEPYTAPAITHQTFPPYDQAKANVYRYRKQQSVNLGSWFVHEAWMTPSVFACATGGGISEIDIAYGWGSTDNARAVLERHWDTFITEQDFQFLDNIGINTVRLPIGYWNLGPDFCKGTPYEGASAVYQNAWPRVIRAINMAGAYGIGVLVDLHGAPGSQNGQHHSGVSDGATNLFDSPDYIGKTMEVLKFLMEQLGYVSNVAGIQILNEPQNVPSLTDFYSNAISTMREVSPIAATFPLYLHDGFDLGRFSDYVTSRNDFVVQDHHSYFVFTPQDEAEPAKDHMSDVEGNIADSFRRASERQRWNLVIDEWSCALTDQSLSSEQDPVEARRAFCTGQMEVYSNTTAGWSFWAYRKEECETDAGWCFLSAIGKALPSTFFSYGVGRPFESPTLPDSTLVNPMQTPTTNSTNPYSFFLSLPSYDPTFRRTVRSHGRRTQDVIDPKNASAYSGDPSRTQQSISRGYSDGFITAKIFAMYGLSKLGFTGQYIQDSLTALGPDVIASGTEGYYKDWFMKGLADGEALILSTLAVQ